MFDNRLPSATPARPLADPTPSPGAFVMCPPMCLPAWSPELALRQQALYEWALNQARAVVRPSLPERDLLAVWN